MEQQIIDWYRLNNNHPADNERFFRIVLDSVDAAIDRDTFERALRGVNQDITDEDIDRIFFKYQNLREFLLYLDER